MKIRIKGDSIRLRLSKTEVDNFSKNGFLEERTSFCDNQFVYRMESRSDFSELSAALDGQTMTVYVPETQAKEWTSTDLVGFENNMNTGEGKTLFLLVEKDFVCLDNTLEDQSDNYPNPNAMC